MSYLKHVPFTFQARRLGDQQSPADGIDNAQMSSAPPFMRSASSAHTTLIR
jgi:hypothetical protein